MYKCAFVWLHPQPPPGSWVSFGSVYSVSCFINRHTHTHTQKALLFNCHRPLSCWWMSAAAIRLLLCKKKEELQSGCVWQQGGDSSRWDEARSGRGQIILLPYINYHDGNTWNVETVMWLSERMFSRRTPTSVRVSELTRSAKSMSVLGTCDHICTLPKVK